MGKAAGTMEGGGEGGQWLGYRILRVLLTVTAAATHREKSNGTTRCSQRKSCPRGQMYSVLVSIQTTDRAPGGQAPVYQCPYQGRIRPVPLPVPTPQTARNLSSSPVFNNPTSTADSALSAFLSGRWVLPSSFSHPRLPPSFFFILSSFSASSSTSSILSLFLCCVVVCGRVSLSLSSIRLV